MVLTLIRDITEQRLLEDSLQTLAHSYELTGIANRRHFRALCRPLLVAYPDQTAVFLVDIDNFKGINDQFGHDVGDDVLRHFVRLIQAEIRTTDIFARYGGDEFIIFAPSIGAKHSLRLGNVICQQVVSSPFRKNGIHVEISASIGISLSSNETTLLDRLIKNADLALYKSKNNGKNQVSLT